jgi:high-affinity iron transporter
MLAAAIIVFREVLEAALIVGIVMATLKGVPGRGRVVAGGIALGVAGAGLIALLAEQIAAAASGSGQEILNAIILFAAVAMLAWHNAWMSSHGRKLATEFTVLGLAVSTGTRPLRAVTAVVALAVLREGSEVVLFLYGLAVSSQGPVGILSGSLLGIGTGALAGYGIYAGLLRIPMRYLFSVTGGLILLLAAGMAAQGANFLVQADLLPPLGRAIWDTSQLLSDNSLLGRVLHALVGYVARPSGIQILFYIATILVITLLSRVAQGTLHGRHASAE